MTGHPEDGMSPTDIVDCDRHFQFYEVCVSLEFEEFEMNFRYSEKRGKRVYFSELQESLYSAIEFFGSFSYLFMECLMFV